MQESSIWYLLSFFPFVGRITIAIRFWSYMGETLSPEEQQTETHRAIILALAGFSFTGFLALTLLDPSVGSHLDFAAYCLLVSFVSYFGALSFQGYKFYRWRDLIGDTLMETASLGLILSIVGVISVTRPNGYWSLVTGLSLVLWLVDYGLRLKYMWRYLHAKEEYGDDK